MCEINNPYLQWATWPVWPEKKNIEYDKFYVNTGRRNGKTEEMMAALTPVIPEIKRVIFHEPATIVFWSDSTKTVVKCMEGEEFDEEKGIAMAFMKKLYGKGYMNKIRKHIPTKIYRCSRGRENVEN